MKRTVMIDARKAKGLTQEQLAKQIGISRAYLTNIERGEHTPSLKVAQKISNILEAKTDDLFSENDARNSNIKEAI